MQTLIIYDNEGVIISQTQGTREPVGIPFLHVDIPQNKAVASINVAAVPHKPVFIDIPPQPEQIIQSLEAKQLQNHNDIMTAYLAITEVYENLITANDTITYLQQQVAILKNE